MQDLQRMIIDAQVQNDRMISKLKDILANLESARRDIQKIALLLKLEK